MKIADLQKNILWKCRKPIVYINKMVKIATEKIAKLTTLPLWVSPNILTPLGVLFLQILYELQIELLFKPMTRVACSFHFWLQFVAKHFVCGAILARLLGGCWYLWMNGCVWNRSTYTHTLAPYARSLSGANKTHICCCCCFCYCCSVFVVYQRMDGRTDGWLANREFS